MKENFTELLTTSMFRRLPFDAIADLIRQPTETPGNDEVKFHVIASWIKADKNGSHSEHLTELLSLVVPDNLSVGFIADQIALDSATFPETR